MLCCDQVVQGQADSWVVPAYGVFMAVWSTFFLEFWKREEARKGVEWGLSGFEETQRPRPGFVAKKDSFGYAMTEVNAVTQALEKHYPTQLRNLKVLTSTGERDQTTRSLSRWAASAPQRTARPLASASDLSLAGLRFLSSSHRRSVSLLQWWWCCRSWSWSSRCSCRCASRESSPTLASGRWAAWSTAS